MARAAIVLQVLVSSPSDVTAECATIISAIRDWNSSHSATLGIILDPVQWQTHTYPESGDRPQAIINRQIVDESDLVVALFGHRIGTATGNAQSGTIEEIERLRDAGKLVLVYFSNAPVPRNHDPEQLRKLKQYRESLQQNTLYRDFESSEQLYRYLLQHLAQSVPRIFQKLDNSGTIRILASQLPGTLTKPDLAESPRQDEPLTLQHVFVGEFPEPIVLRLTANRPFRVTGLEYLDENGVRVSSDDFLDRSPSTPKESKGQQLEVPIDHAKLVQVHNLKPRSGSGAFPIQFRVHLEADGTEQTQTIPALLRPAFKAIDRGNTYVMKVVG